MQHATLHCNVNPNQFKHFSNLLFGHLAKTKKSLLRKSSQPPCDEPFVKYLLRSVVVRNADIGRNRYTKK